nr:uncharacterized protein LOC122270970 [Parasteatoda tepidariorum]
MDKKDCRVYYSCQDKIHQFGVGFVVSKRLRNTVIDFQAISMRLCKIRINGKHYNTTLICAHAPTEEKDASEKDIFYDLLMRSINSCPAQDMKIVIGDFNAKIGKEQHLRYHAGAESLHYYTSENGQRLFDLAVSENLFISSTAFPHKEVHKHTWRSPDGSTHNQIDHLLVDKRHRSNVLDVRSCRGANVDMHVLVVSKVRLRLCKSFYQKKENKDFKLDISKLKKDEILKEYNIKLSNRLSEEKGRPNIVFNWNTIKDIVLKSASDTIPELGRPSKNEWFDEDCHKATEEKNKAYRLMIQKHRTRFFEEQYKNLRRIEKKLHKAKKKAFFEKSLEDLEAMNNQNECRKFYKKVNYMRSEFKPRTITCRNNEGELVSEPQEVTKVWKSYFQDLLVGKDDISVPRNNPVDLVILRDVDNPPPSIDEVIMAIKKLRNNRSAGPDCIPSELLKTGEPQFIDAIHKLLIEIWDTENIPIEWEEGSICPIFKKGDQLECRNYRGITLLNTAYKIFSNILFKRLQPFADKAVGNYQCGFRPQRSTIDQIHTLRQILEKTKEFNIRTFHLFIDFKAAYDSIKRDKLLEAMNEFGIPTKLVSLTRATINNVRCRIKIQSHLSEPFITERGLRQGDSLACLLFNLALEKCIRDSGLNRGGSIWNRSLQILAYADDIDIIGRSERAVKDAFQALEASAINMGLSINEDKTKFMEFSSSTVNYSEPLQINGHSFEKVKEFKYLGTIINDQNKLKPEIDNRINMANRCFFGLKSQLRSNFISQKTKLKLYKTLILPVLLYGNETWTLNLDVQRPIETFERKILRTIFGAIPEGGCWRTRYNFELYGLYKHPQIMQIIRSNRLRWLGHIWRGSEDSPVKIATFKNPQGSRSRGRPPTRWLNDTENDLKVLKLKNWRGVAMDRGSWRRRAVEAAKACKGLLRS